jgi:NADH-quinone oxidoreductase subunit N
MQSYDLLDFVLYLPELYMIFSLMLLLMFGIHYAYLTYYEKGLGHNVAMIQMMTTGTTHIVQQKTMQQALLSSDSSSSNHMNQTHPVYGNEMLQQTFNKAGPANMTLMTWSVVWCGLVLMVLNLNTMQNCVLLSGAFHRSSLSTGLSEYLFLFTAFCLALTAYKKTVAEYSLILLLCTLAMHMLIMCTDLMSLYLCLELQSFCLVVLCCMNYKTIYSVEAGIKYFLLSAFSSAILVLGMSLIYSFFALTDCNSLFEAVNCCTNDSEKLIDYQSVWVTASIWLISLGLLWKLAAAPVHFWAADVYQGVLSHVTLFMSTLPKLAVLGFWINTWHNSSITCMPMVVDQPVQCMQNQTMSVWLLSFVTSCCLMLGAFSALGQVNVKRLLAFSSIAQMGFLLMPLCSNSTNSLPSAALLTHLVIYIVTSLAFWALLIWPARTPQFLWHWSSLRQTHSEIALIFVILLMSLAGLPPIAGFLGKLGVFTCTLNAQGYGLVALALISTCISTYYYVNVINIMYLEQPEDWIHFQHKMAEPQAYLVTLFTLFLCVTFWYSNALLLWHELLVTPVMLLYDV